VSRRSAGTAAGQRRRVLKAFVLACAVVLAAVAPSVPADPPAASRPAAAPAPSAPGRAFDLTVRNGRPVPGPVVLKVTEGDEVTLRITSNRSDELHLHGYDLRAALKPGETVELHLTARLAGRFGIELHHANIEVGSLEVYPR